MASNESDLPPEDDKRQKDVTPENTTGINTDETKEMAESSQNVPSSVDATDNIKTNLGPDGSENQNLPIETSLIEPISPKETEVKSTLNSSNPLSCETGNVKTSDQKESETGGCRENLSASESVKIEDNSKPNETVESQNKTENISRTDEIEDHKAEIVAPSTQVSEGQSSSCEFTEKSLENPNNTESKTLSSAQSLISQSEETNDKNLQDALKSESAKDERNVSMSEPVHKSNVEPSHSSSLESTHEDLTLTDSKTIEKTKDLIPDSGVKLNEEDSSQNEMKQTENTSSAGLEIMKEKKHDFIVNLSEPQTETKNEQKDVQEIERPQSEDNFSKLETESTKIWLENKTDVKKPSDPQTECGEEAETKEDVQKIEKPETKHSDTKQAASFEVLNEKKHEFIINPSEGLSDRETNPLKPINMPVVIPIPRTPTTADGITLNTSDIPTQDTQLKSTTDVSITSYDPSVENAPKSSEKPPVSDSKNQNDPEEVANFPMSKFSKDTIPDEEEKMEVGDETESRSYEDSKRDAKVEEFLKHDRVENLKNESSKLVPSPMSEDTSEDSQFSNDIPSSPQPATPSIVNAFKETAMDGEEENSMDVPMFDTPLGTPISMLASDTNDNQDDTQASVVSNDNTGPTPTKKPRMGSLISARQEFGKLVITVDKLYEYQWPPGEGDWHMLQEQVSEYLSIKSFKRKYPEMYRRFVDKEEKEFLMDQGVVTETHCDLGLTAVRSEDIYDLMYKDYPEKYEEFLTYMHGKQRETIYEKHKEYDMPNVEKDKLAEYMKKAVKSAAEFNSQMQKERRDERRAFFDLQTFSIQYPAGKYKVLPPELTKPSAYPIALIPGQFQEHYNKFTPDELKYLPINTAMYDLPKRMEADTPKDCNQGQSEVDDSQGDKTASSDSDGTSDSGSEESGGEENDGKEKEKNKDKQKADPVKETTCRRCEIKNKNKKRIRRIKEEIINCSECGAGGHPTCLELTNEMVEVIATYPWQCMECKTCVECMDPYDEDKMMFCDRCDRGYHTFCVGVKSIPTGRWECKSCKGVTNNTSGTDSPKPTTVITETPKSKKGR